MGLYFSEGIILHSINIVIKSNTLYNIYDYFIIFAVDNVNNNVKHNVCSYLNPNY